ncbi:methyl-accepting chemotaxis protein [Trichlorobacter ammonificans]|uniref:Methyl-accepting chemotaxis protein n=1 Tax=Trichlorobacter ammonificans TaxID=2916410 RepID=A0ABM9D7G9_9BACT|nr:methyl-accepting chemotaxis protein [Trichlorobacter ammonificans]CAH2031152.1 Methyl-accepting chemotaxis protein [Trichlorobacter ammonificans]
MEWFNRLTVGVRLLTAFLIMAGLTAVVGGVGIWDIDRMNSMADQIYENELMGISYIKEANIHLVAMDRAQKNMLLASEAKERTAFRDRIEARRRLMQENIEKAKPLFYSEAGRQLMAKFSAAWDEYLPHGTRVTELALSEELQQSRSSVALSKGIGREKLDKVDDLMTELARLKEQNAQEFSAATTALYQKSRLFMILLSLGSIVFGIIFGILITRGLTRQLGGEPAYISDIAQQVANGDLTIRFATNDKPATGVYAAMKTMVAGLQELIAKTVDVSSGIASASHQLHATAEQIATGAEEVAAQAGTVATASEEMAATSNDIAQNCSMAAEASQQSTAAAQSGAVVVQETITGMELIAEHVRGTARTIATLGSRSEQIGNIVGTIEDIADQTNLLALNAAIEAARAGEQGRGFAVVADEVRALAERTTKATREIGEMIKAIQKETQEAVKAMESGVHEVEKGAASSQKSGQALQEILQRISEVSLQVSQIATAAEEQTATTSEVTTNVQQITDVVHQTASGAEETAAAASQLARQAQDLQALINRFKV